MLRGETIRAGWQRKAVTEALGLCLAAVNHNALPRLHSASPDTLETGMVFNVEPAIYIESYDAMRHCDMVFVTETGAAVLTDFQHCVEELTNA